MDAHAAARSGLLARALGRTSVPDWLKQRAVDGTLQVDDLAIAGGHLENVKTRVVWDVTRVQLEELQARLDKAVLNGAVIVNLRGARPSYRMDARVKGLNWQAGRLDGQTVLETSGTGLQLVTNLTAEGSFTGNGFRLRRLQRPHGFGELQPGLGAHSTAAPAERPEPPRRRWQLYRPGLYTERWKVGGGADGWPEGSPTQRSLG
ncbi:MAG: hypothetical protein WDO73_18645 [Ignavibacteriota bacterium]